MVLIKRHNAKILSRDADVVVGRLALLLRVPVPALVVGHLAGVSLTSLLRRLNIELIPDYDWP